MDNFDKLYIKVLKFLSFRPRSEKEVGDYLKKIISKKRNTDSIASPAKRGSLQNDIEIIIQKLKAQKFVNDLEFAKWWIEQRTKVKPIGWKLIQLELKQKGIDKELIEELGIMNYELRDRDDLKLAKELLERYKRKFEKLDKQKLYQKAGAFLSRRGFDFETIKKSIDEVFGK